MKKGPIFIIAYIVALLGCAFLIANADESLIWQKGNGNIITHGDYISYQDGKASCGGTTLSGIKTNAVGSGTVAVWVDGAKNISELGAITEISWQSMSDDVFQMTTEGQAILDTIAKINHKTTNFVYNIYKDKKKDKKRKKK